MTPQAEAYAAFMLDYAAGALSPAERLAAALHRSLSAEGGRNALLMDAMGGLLLEEAAPRSLDARFIDADARRLRRPAGADLASEELTWLLSIDLLSLRWRKSLFGVKTLPTGLPLAHLLRLDPGETAPRHSHGRRDVTVVLQGAFADDHGTYGRGDLAFAEPGMSHEPRAVGDESCVCLLATESGRPISGMLGLFGLARRGGRNAH